MVPFQSKCLHLPWKKTEALHHPLQTSLLLQSIFRKVLSSDHTEEKCRNFLIFKFARRLFNMREYWMSKDIQRLAQLEPRIMVKIKGTGHALEIWICGCTLFYRREL